METLRIEPKFRIGDIVRARLSKKDVAGIVTCIKTITTDTTSIRYHLNGDDTEYYEDILEKVQ